MDKTGKILLAVVAGAVLIAAMAMIAMIAITQRPTSESVSLLIGDSCILQLADNCAVRVEYMSLSEDDYNYLQDVTDNLLHLERCEGDITKIGLVIYTVLDGAVINKHIDLSVGGVGIFYNPTDKKEYLIFFERVVPYPGEVGEDRERKVAAFLRVRQL